MKFGIISDTHDHRANVARAVDIFTEQNVDYILHAGDIISPSTAVTLAKVKNAKFIGVFGNCCRDKKVMAQEIQNLGGEIHSHIYNDKVGPLNVFITHKPEDLDKVTENSDLDLAVFGHTHKKFVHKIGQSLVINPGESHVIILDIDEMSIKEIPL
ncbi:MAG: YfcE family phosphodiesterase [Planctomycetota bacterium]|jgi:putative phosphoesterase